jgi:hypothetical protein
MKQNFVVNTWGNDLISFTNTRTNVYAKTHVVITESRILRNRDAMYRIRYLNFASYIIIIFNFPFDDLFTLFVFANYV